MSSLPAPRPPPLMAARRASAGPVCRSCSSSSRSASALRRRRSRSAAVPTWMSSASCRESFLTLDAAASI
eukprot:4392777-Pyramimonas_sp.AAC.1